MVAARRRAGRGALLAAAATAIAGLSAVGDASASLWLAGDLHVHTCYSHDTYCGPSADNHDPTQVYSTGGTVPERFGEAAAKRLDFLAISDHDDIRSQTDSGFGGAGVVGIRAYEASLVGGHAHMLGATRPYGKGDGSARDTNLMANSLRRDGGVFQINHPSYRDTADFTQCSQASSPSNPLFWKYGYQVRPDSLEVWNATTLIPPAEVYWECWLQQGYRIGTTAGSDSHGANTLSVSIPTTWVFAEDSREASILAGIRAGRTTISRLPPGEGATRLLLEGQRSGEAAYNAMIGDSVAPGARMRVRADGLASTGLVRVRANGATLIDGATLPPGGEIDFNAPRQLGWVRAELFLPQSSAQIDPNCQPGSPSPLDFCTADLATAGLTSPIYVEAPSAPGAPPTGTSQPPDPVGSSGPPPGSHALNAADPDRGEPDRERPLAPAWQSQGGAPEPVIPGRTGRSHACTGRRAFTVHLHPPRGRRILRVRATLGGRVLRVVPAGRSFTAFIDLRRAHRGATALRLVIRTTDGRLHHQVRVYHPCSGWRRPGP